MSEKRSGNEEDGRNRGSRGYAVHTKHHKTAYQSEKLGLGGFMVRLAERKGKEVLPRLKEKVELMLTGSRV